MKKYIIKIIIEWSEANNMKFKNRIFIILLLVFFALNVFSINAYAANQNFKLNINTEKENIDIGQEFQISIGISDSSNQPMETGFTYIGGEITYDSNIISYIPGKEEFITESGDVSGLYSAEVSEYNDGGSNISIYYLDANIRTLKLTFKINENIEPKQFTIGFEDFIGTNVDDSSISATANNTQLTLNAINPNIDSGEENVPVRVSQVKLDETEISMYVNYTASLNAIVLPSNATNKNIIWTSSDENVVKVTDGELYGIKVGTAVITATSADNPDISATCIVNVVDYDDSNNDQNGENNQTEDNENNQDSNDGNNQMGEGENEQNYEDNKVDNTVSTQQTLPKAGTGIILIVFIVIFIVISIIIFKRYKYLNY